MCFLVVFAPFCSKIPRKRSIGMSIIYKSKKLCKKVLTKEGESGRILRSPRGDKEILHELSLKKPRKKLKKVLKKVLTKGGKCGIITKLSRKRAANGH